MFNPINNNSSNQTQEFLAEVSDKIDQGNKLADILEEALDTLNEVNEKI